MGSWSWALDTESSRWVHGSLEFVCPVWTTVDWSLNQSLAVLKWNERELSVLAQINNPDMRVQILKDFVKQHFPSSQLLDYALDVEKITTSKVRLYQFILSFIAFFFQNNILFSLTVDFCCIRNPTWSWMWMASLVWPLWTCSGLVVVLHGEQINTCNVYSVFMQFTPLTRKTFTMFKTKWRTRHYIMLHSYIEAL